jgi:hypothetical protein
MYQFTETQKFRQWWLWLIMIVSTLVVPGTLLLAAQSGAEDIPAVAVLISAIVPILILVMFWAMNLHTEIDSTGVHYRFFPFHFSKRTISWDEIDSAVVRKYSPLGEYGGWGLRYTFRNGRAVNVSGNMGLQLVLKTGKKILIGTQRAEEMGMVLRDLGRE